MEPSLIANMVCRRGRASVVWFEEEKSIYALGGSDGHEDLNSIECYDFEKNEWRSIKFEFDLSFTNLGAVACRHFIYLVGLKGDGGKSLSRSSCLRYEPRTNEFKRIGELNNGRSQSALVCSNNFLFVFGGHYQIKCLSSCECYSIQEDKWSIMPSMIESRRGCGAALRQSTNSIYIVGGTNGGKSLKSVEIYDIINKRWSVGPDLNVARTNVAIAFIGDILFAVGGFDGKAFLKNIEYLNCNDTSNGWSMYHRQNDFENLA
jgi:N-acetylneuraminic acid mutarotase